MIGGVTGSNAQGGGWGQVKKVAEPPAPTAPAFEPTPPPPPSVAAEEPSANAPPPLAPAAPLTYAAPASSQLVTAAPMPTTTLARELTDAGYYTPLPQTAVPDAASLPTYAELRGQIALTHAQVIAQAAYTLVAAAKDDARLGLMQQA